MHKTAHPCGDTHPPPPPPPPPLPKPKNDIVPFPIPSLQSYRHHHDPRHRHHFAAAISPPFMVTTVAAATSSWLCNRRIRYFFLLLCSPLLLVLFCAALPFLCAAELCLRRRLWLKLVCGSGDGDDGGDRLRRCEEGFGVDYEEEEEKGLLHRYLEDQLLLVGSMYDCGDDEDEEEEKEEDSRRVEDVENLRSSRIPLLR